MCIRDRWRICISWWSQRAGTSGRKDPDLWYVSEFLRIIWKAESWRSDEYVWDCWDHVQSFSDREPVEWEGNICSWWWHLLQPPQLWRWNSGQRKQRFREDWSLFRLRSRQAVDWPGRQSFQKKIPSWTLWSSRSFIGKQCMNFWCSETTIRR